MSKWEDELACTGREDPNHYDQDIAESVLYIDESQSEGMNLIIRGSPLWDAREETRRNLGCTCLSFGTINKSISTNGKTAQYPPF